MSTTCRVSLAVLAITTLVLGVAADAHASLKLRLSDSSSSSSTTIVDGDALDSNGSTSGIITYVGTVGAFIVQVSTGSSKPVIGSTTYPELAITSLDITGPNTSTLTIELTDTGFGPSTSPTTGFNNTINSASPNTQSVSYSSYIDNANTEFGKDTPITSMGTASGVFNLSSYGAVTTGSPYSVTMVLTLTQSASGYSQFDASLSAVEAPEPSTMITWAGLACLGLIGVKRNRSRQ